MVFFGSSPVLPTAHDCRLPAASASGGCTMSKTGAEVVLIESFQNRFKIATDADEVAEGSAEIAAYYRNHAASTEDFGIEFFNLDVHERDNVAWFYTRQVWRLKWQGTREEFVMRMT